MLDKEYKKVNKSGSINIPVRWRRDLNIQAGDAFEIGITDDGKLSIERYSERCTFCDSQNEVENHLGRGICLTCLTEITEKRA